MQTMLQNVRYAFRQLRKSPGFTITAVLTLALGIGANTAIFTLVHAILLKQLPVATPDQLWRVGDNADCCVEGGFPGDAGDTGKFSIFSTDLYEQLRKQTPEFESLAAMQAGQWRWSVRHGYEAPRPIRGEFVSGNYFATLGVGAWQGRMLTDRDDTASSAPVAVVSYRAWQGEFGANPGIVGSTIFVQTRPFTVVGVSPPSFFGDRVSENPPDFWMSLQMEPYVRGSSTILHHGDQHWLYLIGRLPKGQSTAVVEAKMKATLQQWLWTRKQLLDHGGAAVIPKMHVVLKPGGGGIQTMQEYAGRGLKTLMILSSVVLLIACANIANLMLARATGRRAEIAIRMAMGAARTHVIRQILTESVVLSCVGGLAGLAVAYAGSRTILALAFPEARNMPVDATPSLAVLGFAFLVSLLTGVFFGAGPAWLASHAQPAEVLRGSNRAVKDRSSLPQKALVIGQAALSVVLLCVAVLLTRSLGALEHQDFGITTQNRYVAHIDPQGAGYTMERLPELYRQIEERFKAMPGVLRVSLATYSPLEGDNWGECVIQQGHPQPGPGDRCGSTWVRVSPQYLASIGVPIVQGRDFSEQDTASSPQVVLVNEAFAKKFFPNQNPIGQRFGIDSTRYSGAWQIVGVFRDFKMNNPRDKVRPVYLRPLTQRYMGFTEPEMIGVESDSMNMNAVILDFKAQPDNVDALVRGTLSRIDPNLAVMDLRSLGEQVAGNFSDERLQARLTMLFGGLALVLACVGLYGVTSYFVARRSGEIGIRMALGATRRSVVTMVLRGVMTQIGIGLAIGVPAALGAGYLLKSQLYGVSAFDPLAVAAAVAVLTLCAMWAGYVPARRAATIDPMNALRAD
jgi:macrolide transport system ATP-binding/permease protein